MTAKQKNGTFPDVKMHAPVAAILLGLHLVVVSLSAHLHTPIEHARQHAISIVDLPEHLHRHDFSLTDSGGTDNGFGGDCIGCRLERTAAPPSARDGISVDDGRGEMPTLPGPSAAPPPIRQPPARAPPAA